MVLQDVARRSEPDNPAKRREEEKISQLDYVHYLWSGFLIDFRAQYNT